MANFLMGKAIWTLVALTILVKADLVSNSDIVKCSYGERGSLTATCVFANSSFFRNTPYRFDHLDETLRCVNCTLTTLESGTFDLSGNHIRNLDLANAQIEKLNQRAFVGLIFLENLRLSHNGIRSVYPGTFTGVQKIKSVDLSNNQINILSDDGFAELANLEELNLQFNNIKTISSKAFTGLKKMRVLNLRNNQLTEMRDVFPNETALQLLDLENNNMMSLTGFEFFNLTSLLALNLAHNKLQSPIKLEMFPQNSLRNVYLHHNELTTLSSNFLLGLEVLENLDLSFNRVKEIPQKVLQNLYHLTNLNISYNELKVIQTGTFSGLPQLELLNVSHNHIEEVQITGVFSLHSLHSLDVSHNSIQDLDYVRLISRLPRLSYLRMEDNLLPCDLEDEMTTYFEGDNFKFVFFEPVVGTLKCLDAPTRKSQPVVGALLTEGQPAKSGMSGVEISIFVLICVLFVCVGCLFYLQYRSYVGSRDLGMESATSTVHLVPSDALGTREDGEFLRA